MSIPITVTANVAVAPELKMAGTTPVCKVRIGVSDRYRDSNDGTWKNRPTQFYDVNGWRELATAMNEQLSVGDEVVVVGELRREEWEQDGEKRGRNFIHAQQIAKTLRRPKRQQSPQSQAGAQAPDWNTE